MIAVLCALEKSVYKTIPDLDVYDKNRDAYTFDLSIPIIAHPPCQQWSRLREFSKENKKEKELAFFCLEKIHQNGGVLEHPAGSSFFKEAGIKPTLSIDQAWFGYPARKRTYLYFYGCKPLAFPLTFDLATKKVENMGQVARSVTTLQFAEYLISCVNQVLR
ncbi:hypothetical protein [Pedobacter sp. KBW01]|uniref:hypothetical protein n=1 Tax=Pedobacter sp. KBW01 TaxID=2153364 RepID=UPI000F59F850|nr:hypothetical protein [Pedobacter sp. KBW01]